MTVAESTSSSESEITLGLLRAVQEDASVTQRSAARELGIAVGLANTYFKRCIKKGLIKAQQIPANRYAYYLTPKGFAEKSRLTGEFLSQSLSLFRQAHDDVDRLFQVCRQRRVRRVALVGAGDLARIVLLSARDEPFEIVAVIDAVARETTASYHGIPVFEAVHGAPAVDAYMVTALAQPQAVYDALSAEVPGDRVLVPKLLDLATADAGGGED